jgi:hypothetical protein
MATKVADEPNETDQTDGLQARGGSGEHGALPMSDTSPRFEKKEDQPATATQERGDGWEKEDRSRTLFPWEHLVRLRGHHANEAKHYLATRDGTRCVFCDLKVHDIFSELEFDHIDGNNRNNNRWNLRLAHHICNVAAYHSRKPALSTPEREGGNVSPEASNVSVGLSAPWSNREGEKHDIMRSKWNGWINDLVKGPFRAEGGVMRLRDLVEMAPRMLGLGSSQTYRRYANEDRWGPLEIFREDGILFVRYRGIRDTNC